MDFTKIEWNKQYYNEFIEHLKNHEDLNYKEFHLKILTKEQKERDKIRLIGIRTPILRKIATEISKGKWKEFLSIEKKGYYEETIIRGFIIGKIKNIEELIKYSKLFVKEIDNWAICDLFVGSSSVIRKNKEKYFNFIKTYENTENPWEMRFLLISLLSHYIEEDYLDYIFQITDKSELDHYYVKMGIAWLISIVYIKFPKQTKQYLKINNLSKWTNNKAIQKIRESLRVSLEEKEYVKQYKK
ncbi:DNA alkylation repair protein [Fusobacterium sp. PH5-44]|uniref:DNA alkylation repair protein n=1 Tax=unclassified Fusobacterium TaxID=2648384 RepID=UPI003D2067A8